MFPGYLMLLVFVLYLVKFRIITPSAVSSRSLLGVSGDEAYEIARDLFEQKLYQESSLAYWDAIVKGGSDFKVEVYEYVIYKWN